jgi:hypothetical protein
VRLPAFERDARGLLSEDANRWRGTGGVRKIRIAVEGRGKSGGARVIYYFADRTQRVFLVAVYAKNKQDNLSAADRQQMRRLAAVLEAGS